jgi:D-alanine-D-alanine ligase
MKSKTSRAMCHDARCAARCDVALLVDAETGERDASGLFVPDRGSVEAQVLQALKSMHPSVSVVPFDPAAAKPLDMLCALRPRLVFNLTEWIDGDRGRDHEITRRLDKLGLRYTGTGAEGLKLARDKVRAKKVVAALGVAAPRSVGVFAGAQAQKLPYPLFVKLRDGDGSDAIGAAALVRNAAQLRERLRVTQALNNGPALCEEYVEGRDLFVALLGNQPEVLHPLELVVGRQGRGAPRFATGRLKHDEVYKRRWQVSYRKARLPDAVLTEINDSSRRIFHALKLRDYARIDYRLTPDNRLVFIEANPNPDLGRHTFGRERCFVDVAYAELIGRIVAAARARYARR